MIRPARIVLRAKAVHTKEGRSGFALVAILSVMGLLSGMLLSLSLWSRNSIENAAVAASDLRSDRLMRSAATVAAYQLFVLKLPRGRVDNQQLDLEGGTATITLSDDSGKVDVNRSDTPLLAAAYRAAGLSRMTPEAFAARIADWRDEDDTVSEAGAEAPAYRNAGLPPPRNGEFRTVSDLGWVMGVDQADVKALSPFVTVFNPDGHLNVYSAPQALIRALPYSSPALSAEIKALIEAARSEKNLVRMRSLLADQPFLSVESASLTRLKVKTLTSGTDKQASFEFIATHLEKKVSPVGYFSQE